MGVKHQDDYREFQFVLDQAEIVVQAWTETGVDHITLVLHHNELRSGDFLTLKFVDGKFENPEQKINTKNEYQLKDLAINLIREINRDRSFELRLPS
ncbi:MAG: hypothetical protein R3B41_01460 [Candidatus Doudnabacteria bacterium]